MPSLWPRLNTVLLAIVILALLSIIAMLTVRAEGGPLDPPGPPGATNGVRSPGTPIAGPTTISSPGHYYVTQNIFVPGGASAITITSNDVSLDLGGNVLSGNDSGGFGVIVSGSFKNIAISNGAIRDFQFGISAASASFVTMEHLQVTSNVRGVELGSKSRLSECVVSENTETGVRVVGAFNTVERCDVTYNSAPGITLEEGDNVVSNVNATDNNRSQFSGWGGILVQSASNVIRDSNVGGFIAAISFNVYSTNWVLDTVCTFGNIVRHGTTPYIPGTNACTVEP